MANLTFNDESISSFRKKNSASQKGLLGLLLKYRLAKTEAGAQKILLVVLIVGTVLTLYIAKGLVAPEPLPNVALPL